MGNVLKYNDIKDSINNLGYHLITENNEYINSKSKIVIKDACGYLYTTTFDSLRSGKKPRKFGSSNPYNNQNFDLFLKTTEGFEDFKLISKITENHSYIELVDKYGYKYYTYMPSMLKGFVPLKFYKNNPFFSNNIAIWLNLNYPKYCFVEGDYKNKNSLLTLKDDNGYKYVAKLNTKNKNISKKFHLSNPYTIHNIKKWITISNKNFTLESNEYYGDKLKWKCSNMGCGEIFEASLSSILKGGGCNICSENIVSDSKCLSTFSKQLEKEWSHKKNGELTPDNLTYGSNKSVWWICSDENCRYEWKTSVANRTMRSSGCPACNGKVATEKNNLFLSNPRLCEEFDYEKNNGLTPNLFTPVSGRKVFWKCGKCNESWESTIANRVNGNGCPYCKNLLVGLRNNLLYVNPELCEEWDYEKNKIFPSSIIANYREKVFWKCKKCNNIWEASPEKRNNSGQGCPICSNQSNGEKLIKDFFIKNNIKFKTQKKFNDLFGLSNGMLSYDFYLQDYNLLIEFQGEQHERPIEFFGGDEKFYRQQEHDRFKREYALNNNIRLIEIWYYECNKIKDILKQELKI